VESREPVGTGQQRIAAGCDSLRPTRITGTTLAHDGRAVHLLIGFDLVDTTGSKVDEYGRKCTATGATCYGGGAYSFIVNVNTGLGYDGSTTTAGYTTSVSRCIASNIKHVSAEIYPRGLNGATDMSRYGSARDARDIVSVGGDNTHDFRVPVNNENGGMAGKINGYVYCNGSPVLPTRVNFWSNEGGALCGVQGFRSGAKLSTGFYSSNFVNAAGQEFMVLAAGQCNAPSQKYKTVVWATCNGVSMSRTFYADVCDGCGPRVDIHFPQDAD
jgi:hypothetical protein